MNRYEFAEKVNEKLSGFDVNFRYNPVDGFEFDKSFKFIYLMYDEKGNQFYIEVKNAIIMNNMTTFKYMQELTQAGEILEILKQITI